MTLVKSLYFNQNEILDSIRQLHVPAGFEVDCTYGNGIFWKTQERPRHCFDIEPLFDFVERADSANLPLEESSVGSLVFDPPFLTYVRKQRTGNGKMIMAKRFAGYWSSDELETHYKNTITEARRVLKDNGCFVVKCQDIVHNHALYLTHKKVIDWAEATGFRLLDLFVLGANHRLPSPNRKGKQKHARIFHSYFLVFKAKKKL